MLENINARFDGIKNKIDGLYVKVNDDKVSNYKK